MSDIVVIEATSFESGDADAQLVFGLTVAISIVPSVGYAQTTLDTTQVTCAPGEDRFYRSDRAALGKGPSTAPIVVGRDGRSAVVVLGWHTKD